MTNRAREVSNVFQNSGRGKNKNTGKYSPPQPKFQTADYAEGTRIGASLNIHSFWHRNETILLRENRRGNFAIDRCLELILLQLESEFRIDRRVQS
jgi:hypothetical protein